MTKDRRAQTTKIGGGADYAKVAERLKLFREDNKNSKHESAYETDVDGSLVFTVWLWKDKADLMELMKSGITDKEALRSSADANGNARSSGDRKATKDFEKLESIALGRALANLGYLASGEIASSEEMEEFEKFKKEQLEEASKELLAKISETKTGGELAKLLKANLSMLKNPAIVKAGKVQQAKLKAAKENKTNEAN